MTTEWTSEQWLHQIRAYRRFARELEADPGKQDKHGPEITQALLRWLAPEWDFIDRASDLAPDGARISGDGSR